MTAEQLRRAGNAAAAVDLCRDALARFPGHLSARVTLGWALLDLGRLKEAREELETVRRSAPDNFAAIRGLAQLHVLDDNDQDTYAFAIESEATGRGRDEGDAPAPVQANSVSSPLVSPVVARLESMLSRVEALRAAV